MTDTTTTPYDRVRLVDVLVYHWRTNTAGCGCGWGELGRSHPEHVADVYEASVAAAGGGTGLAADLPELRLIGLVFPHPISIEKEPGRVTIRRSDAAEVIEDVSAAVHRITPDSDSDRPEPVRDSWAGERPTLHYWPDTLTTADVALLAEHGVGSPLTLATLPGGRLGALSEATGIPAERLRPVIPGASPELVEKMWDPAVDGWVDMPALGSSAVPGGVPAASDPGFLLALAAASTNADVDVIVSLADEVARLTARAIQVEGAARRLLDGCTPQVSALELEHGVDADDLYGDLAEALGLPRDYRPEER